jgi:hypothetical protein
VQGWIGGSNVADPTMPSQRAIIKGGKRHLGRSRPESYSGGLSVDSMGVPVMDSINYVQEAQTTRGGIINAQMDTSGFSIANNFTGATSNTTLPRVTYSATNQSKSYSPGTVTLGASSLSGPLGKLGG